VLCDILPDEGRSKEGRKQLVDKAVAALKATLKLPDEVRESVIDQFDPVMIVNEIVAEKMPSFLDALIDYEGDCPGFITLLKTRSAELIVEIIREIEEGFIDGINDILVFFKVNASDLLMASAPPQQANMAKGIAIPTALRFIEKCWNEKDGQKSEPTPKPQAKAEPAKKPAETPKAPEPVTAPKAQAAAQPQDMSANSEPLQPLSEFLARAQSGQERKQLLLERYRQQLQRDQAVMQQAGASAVRPLSRAYQALDLTANNTLVEEEEKLSM